MDFSFPPLEVDDGETGGGGGDWSRGAGWASVFWRLGSGTVAMVGAKGWGLRGILTRNDGCGAARCFWPVRGSISTGCSTPLTEWRGNCFIIASNFGSRISYLA